MPIKDGKIFCLNHPTVTMVRNSGFNALITLQRLDTGIVFNASNGIPLVVFYCNECGYIESYAAQKTPYWNEFEKVSGTAITRAAEFEEAVVEALISPFSPFQSATVERQVFLKSGTKTYVADAIVNSTDGIYVIEAKASQGKKNLESAAAQVLNNANLYKNIAQKNYPNSRIYPLIIVPSDFNVDDEILGVPVLKFSPEQKLFVNSDIILGKLKANLKY